MDYYKSLLMMGAFQALVMTCFLFASKNNRTPNRILSVMTLSWSICCLTFAVQSNQFWYDHPHFFRIGSVFVGAFFPSIYLYVKQITKDGNGFESRSLLHYLPSFIYVILNIPYYILSTEEKRLLLFERSPIELYEYLELTSLFSDILPTVQGLIYSALSIKLLKSYEKSIKNLVSDTEPHTLKWLKNLILLNVGLWLLGSSGFLLDLLGKEDYHFRSYQILYLSIVGVTYFITYYALKQPEIFTQLSDNSLIETSENVRLEEEVDHELEEEANRLKAYLIDQRPYLNNQLTLPDLAKEFGLTRHRMSFVLNHAFGKNFYDVINDFRVEEAKRLLADEAHKEYKIEYIAQTSGFNSKATFNRIFKLRTEMTPSEFRNLQLA
ncbi:helix-turn-helix domain-containing protein [Sediminitomix flava]|uniref:AraC family transcriptional regulator n=1 Tax=Sediminitomix flava TaxID=379075 RepID=A0A315ZGM6_SEDFL|nr:helix-turn-helix domain-containing protein [Sediminitomix flava]PWJ44671.1 AraC family transcriptional regulator [Sediminitomix flava]